MGRKLKAMPIPYHLVLIAALVMSLLKVFESYLPYYFADARYPWAQFLGHPIAGYFLWALASPLIYSLFHWRSNRFGKMQRLVWLFVLGWGIAAVHGLGEAGLCILLAKWVGGVDTVNATYLLNIMVQSFVAYWMIVGAFAALDLVTAYRDQEYQLVLAEKEATTAQLRALKMQLNPHFLFNALHSVGALMEDSIDAAQKVLSRLALLLRTMLDADQQHTVSLHQEIKWLKDYLTIEQVRFGERLALDFQVDEAAEDGIVPYLILQPLVENALKHGFSRSAKGGQITIMAQRIQDQLHLRVLDNGKGCSEPHRVGSGVGTRNVRDRLAQIYGLDFDLQFKSPTEGGFEAHIILPFSLEHPQL